MRALVWPVGVTLGALAFWESLVVALNVEPLLLPAPSAIGQVMVARRDLLLAHAWPTFYQTVLGFLLAVVGGSMVAVLFTYSRAVRAGVYPLIVVAQIVPKVSVAPLFIVWFGTGDVPRLVLAGLVAFFPMVVNTTAGLQSVDEDTLRMARACMGRGWRTFTKVRLPHALPAVFAGMRISVTLAVIGVIVSEFVAAQRGLGYLIVVANGLLDTPLMMAAIAVLSLLGLALYTLVALLERWLVYWRSPAPWTGAA